MLRVLYEDDVLIAVDKPSGLPSQGTLDPNRDHCYAMVQRYLGEKGHAYVGMHHRLDALTSGVLVFTKSQTVNASLSEQFQTHTIQKTYRALCLGTPNASQCVVPGKSFVIRAGIGEVGTGRVQKYSTEAKKRKPAITEVVCLGGVALPGGTYAEFQCRPKTGRTHQIRVHLASLGLSILGDPLYAEPLPRNFRSISPKRMFLHAESITLVHPVTGEPLTIEAPLPAEFGQFGRQIEKMKRRLLP